MRSYGRTAAVSKRPGTGVCWFRPTDSTERESSTLIPADRQGQELVVDLGAMSAVNHLTVEEDRLTDVGAASCSLGSAFAQNFDKEIDVVNLDRVTGCEWVSGTDLATVRG